MSKLVTTLVVLGLVSGPAFSMGSDPKEESKSTVKVAAPAADNKGKGAVVAASKKTVSTTVMDIVPAFEKSRVNLSGEINTDFMKTDYPVTVIGESYFGSTGTHHGRHVYVGNAQLDVDANVEAVEGHVGLVYLGQNDTTNMYVNNNFPAFVDEAYLHWENIFDTPFNIKAGEMYTDFGVSGRNSGMVDHYPLIKSSTQLLTQTRARVVQVAINDVGLNGLHLLAYGQDSAGTNEVAGNSIGNWGGNIGYNFSTNFVRDIQWGLDISYVQKENGIDFLQTIPVTSAHKRHAYAANAYAQSGRFSIEADYVRLDSTNDVDTAKPKAWNVLVGFTDDLFGQGTDTSISLFGGKTSSAAHLGVPTVDAASTNHGLPRSTYGAIITQGINDSSSLELMYSHDKNYNITGVAGLKGQTNQRFGARLSFCFD